MRITKKMFCATGDAAQLAATAAGNSRFTQDARLSRETIEAAQEELDMLKVIFHAAKR